MLIAKHNFSTILKTMDLEQPIEELKGVGEVLAKKLATVSVKTVQDLLDNYPRRYEDYSQVQDIVRIKPGPVTIKAVIKQATGRYVRRGMHITEAVASDETGSVRLIWFNQPYRARALKRDEEYFISGPLELNRQRLSIMNPSAELASTFTVSTARIVPVYRETKGLKSVQIRKLLKDVFQKVEISESLPAWLLKDNHLIPRHKAVMTMHFPSSNEDLEAAKRRLGFEEVFELTLAALLNKHELSHQKALQIPFDEKLARDFVKHLPFRLTDAQRKTVWQIYKDMQTSQPMNRLIEGDVGSGKTVVAVMAAVMAMREGFQVALMAPTELLARQHAETIIQLLNPLGLSEQVGLLIGSMPSKQKDAAYKRLVSGDMRLVVGTHALIQEKVDMHRLGLIVIDEQHRFGVEQRKKLQAKAGHMPHVLHMTATPIPRSLALTLYGELDISVIDTKPEGRKPVKTKVCSPNSRAQLYEAIDKQIEEGSQVFVVCPLIAPQEDIPGDEKVPDSMASVEEVYEKLRKGPFKHRRVGLLHGKMKSDQKNTVMERFVSQELDILVATTVIEVGVNVPNATVMLIESAERFGLAQIHQLRGRVGRSNKQGWCYLMMSDSFAPSRRLRALEQSSDGFALAELDLEIRGPGAIYGTFQHGQLDLRVAKLTDAKLIAAARQNAQAFIMHKENLLQYPRLHKRVMKLRSVTNLN